MQNNNNFKSNIEDVEINTNTHGICIWKDISECSNCNINNKLHCHVHIKYSIYVSLQNSVFFILESLLKIRFRTISEYLEYDKA